MKTETAPLQGGNPSWELICIADAIDEISDDHAFLLTLHEIARDRPSLMDGDLFRLLTAYLDTEPREKINQASEKLTTVARSLRDRRPPNNP